MFFDFLLHKITYSYNDMAILFVYARQIHYGVQHFPFVNTSLGIFEVDLINNILLYIFFKLFAPVLAFNLLVLFYAALLFGFSYALFKHLLRHRGLVLVLALINTVNIYTVYRVISFTPNIYQLFFYPLTLFLLIKGTRPLYMSGLLLFFFSFSAYTAYFSLLMCVFWYLITPFFEQVPLGEKLKRSVLSIGSLVLPVILLGTLLFWNIVSKSLPVFSSTPSSTVAYVANSTQKTYRPIENFYNLSTRPWYFLIPPKGSTYFGNMSKDLHSRITASNYYLADDYTEEEAAGSFMGWHFLLGGAFVFITVVFYKTRLSVAFSEVQENRTLLLKLFIVIFLLFLFSLPPSFTVSGFTFYMPTYLIFYVLPVFRTLVRVSAPIFLLLLVINGYLIQDILEKFNSRAVKIGALTSVLVVSYFMFSINTPTVDVTDPPEEIRWLQKVSSVNFNYAVYPSADYKSIFWSVFLQKGLVNSKGLVNPIDFVNPATGFDANLFSSELITSKGVKSLRQLDTTYLVVYLDDLTPHTLGDISVLNANIKSQQDVLQYFKGVFGDPVFVTTSAHVFKVPK